MELHFVGETINNKKIAMSLEQEGQETYRLVVAIDDDTDYNELFESSEEEALQKYRAKQFEYFGRVKDIS